MTMPRSTGEQIDEVFPACPECSAPWRLHWVYVRGVSGERRRRYNTCGMTRGQLAVKWLPEGERSGD